MKRLSLMPQNAEVLLPVGTPLTELEYELDGQTGVKFGCKAGACGCCVIEVVQGRNHLGSAHSDEVSFLQDLGYDGEQFRLACQCQLLGDATINTVP